MSNGMAGRRVRPSDPAGAVKREALTVRTTADHLVTIGGKGFS